MFELSTLAFRRVMVGAVARASASERPCLDAADVVRVLLDMSWTDGHAFLVFVGVDVVGAAQRAARLAPGPELVTDADLPGRGGGLPFSVELKTVVRMAARLQQDSGRADFGTDHLAAALLVCPSNAAAALARPPLTRRKATRALRDFAATRPQGEARFHQLCADIGRASALKEEGSVLAMSALLDQIGPALAEGDHPWQSAQAALLSVGAAQWIDEASFASASAVAGPLVAATGSPSALTHLRIVVGAHALDGGDIGPIRSLVADADAGAVELEPEVAAIARSQLLQFDGALDGARTTLAARLDDGTERKPAVTALLLAELANVARLAQRPADATEAARQAFALASVDGAHPPFALIQHCAEVMAKLGQPEARQPLEWVVGVAHGNGLGRVWTCAQFGLCTLKARLQPDQACGRALVQLVGQLDQQGLRLEAIDALLELAHLAGVLGRPHDVTPHLDDAAARARAIGSFGWSARVDVVRRELDGE